MQLRSPGTMDDACIVARADRVEAECLRTVENRREFDGLIAAQAGIGSSTGSILLNEVLDDLLGELLGEIPYIKGNPQHVSDASCVMGIRSRAAALRTTTHRRCASERKVDADNIVAGVNSASSRNSRIDPTRKCSDHTHVSGPGVVGVLPLERLGPVLPA